jgi:hypothetical protein
VGSSSKLKSPVSLTSTEDVIETIKEFDKTRGKLDKEEAATKIHDSSRDFAIESSGVPRSIHQLCVIITKAAEEGNHEGSKEVDLQVEKSMSSSKKEKEKIHVSAGEWRIIMTAVNHGTEVPTDSRREVLMGYQYALHQRKKKLREERDMFMRSRGDDSISSGEYWDEYSDASESSMERHRDPKHNRRTNNTYKRRELREESERTTVRRGRRFHSRDTRTSFGSSVGIPTNHATRAWRSTGAHASGRNTKPRVSRK